MVRPEDLIKVEIEEVNFKEIEKQIDSYILKTHGNHPWEEAIIEHEYSVAVRDIIAYKYKENGWRFVYHRTSSENKEKPGLTQFRFSLVELEEKYSKGFHKI